MSIPDPLPRRIFAGYREKTEENGCRLSEFAGMDRGGTGHPEAGRYFYTMAGIAAAFTELN